MPEPPPLFFMFQSPPSQPNARCSSCFQLSPTVSSCRLLSLFGFQLSPIVAFCRQLSPVAALVVVASCGLVLPLVASCGLLRLFVASSRNVAIRRHGPPLSKSVHRYAQ